MSQESPKTSLAILILTLTLIAALSGFLLSSVYNLTNPIIQTNQQMRLKENLVSLLGEFDNNPLEEAFTLENFPDLRFFPATRNGELSALGVKSVTNKGYGGDISLLVGFDSSARVMNIRVLKQKETPGLGTRVTEEEFLHQFKDLSKDVFPVSLKKDNGTIDAITAATISSRAFLDALNKAQIGALQAITQITKKEAL